MTNELLTDWRLRTKFVTLGIIPINAISLTNTVAGNVNDFAENNHMKLNPKKCKRW
jgi:hypothetical protein